MEHDFCDREGACRLKQKIEEYWLERGHSVDVKLVEARFHMAMRSARTDIRSDMVNGMPRQAFEQHRGAAEKRLQRVA